MTGNKGGSVDRTLVLVKPDAYQRGLTGEIIMRFERKGLRLCALKRMQLTREIAEAHYAEHHGKPFYEPLVDFITGGPLVALVLEGREAVSLVRAMVGATDPLKAAPGSIRGDLGIETKRNLVHASDSPESAEREISIFFPDFPS